MLRFLKVWYHSKGLEDFYADAESRIRAAEALGAVGGASAVAALLWTFRDPRDTPSEVRRAIIEILGRIDHPDVFEPLIIALNDSDGNVRKAAGRTLTGMGKRAAGHLKAAMEDSGYGPPPGPETINAVAKVLAAIGNTGAVGPLLENISNEDEDVRRSAIEALGDSGDRQAVPHIIKALSDSSTAVREAAIRALGRLKDRQAAGPLVRMLGCIWGEDRLAAASSLAELGERKWLRLIKGDDDDFKRLRESGDADSVEAPIAGLEDRDGFVRRCAAEALGDLGLKMAVEPLVKTLGDGVPQVRRAAVEALGKIGDPNAIVELVKKLADGDSGVSYAAADALIGWPPPAPPELVASWPEIYKFAVAEEIDCPEKPQTRFEA